MSMQAFCAMKFTHGVCCSAPFFLSCLWSMLTRKKEVERNVGSVAAAKLGKAEKSMAELDSILGLNT